MPLYPRWPARVLVAGLILATVVGTPGCAAFQASPQAAKRDLAVLSPGVGRSRVIAELGAPIYTEERFGHTVDLFSFRQGDTKPAKAGRAHGAADILTGGLWETALAAGTEVKVEVTYDNQRNVQGIQVIQGQDVVPIQNIAVNSPELVIEPAGGARQPEVSRSRNTGVWTPDAPSADTQPVDAIEPAIIPGILAE